jgi:hypothetical protein
MAENDKLMRFLLFVGCIFSGVIIGAGLFPLLFLVLDTVISGKKMGLFGMLSLTVAPIIGILVGALIGARIALLLIRKKLRSQNF